MKQRPTNKKAKKLFKYQKDDFAVYSNDEDNDIFEGGTLISSGLGGEMHRLRYFVVISTKECKNFIGHQKNIVEKKLTEVTNKHDSKVEEIKFYKNYALIKILISVDVSVEEAVDSFLVPLSKGKGFLRFHYFCMNTHKPTKKETDDRIKELHSKEKGGK